MNTLRSSLRSGFTMVEVALSILVVAVGLLGVFALFPIGLHAGRDAVDDTEIMMVSETLLSNLQNFMATNYTDRATGFVYDFNGTRILAGQATKLIKEDGFSVLCTVQLKVEPIQTGRLAGATVTCWPGNNTKRTIKFYSRCVNRKPL